MKIKIKQSVLKRELGFIQSVVQQKSTIPVLSHLLFETIGEKEVRIWATDLDVSIRCDIEAEVITPGSICLQARKISDIVRNVDDCDMHFKLDKKSWINLKAARSNFRLAGIDREKFPEIAKPNGTAMSFPADVLEYMIKHTAFAITTEQSRFTLNGAKFVLNDKTARMVATDGHRLAFIEKEMPTKAAKNVDTLIPKKALLELAKMAGEQSGNINISEDPQHIFFEGETRLLIARKLAGTFPNYEMIMPKDNGNRAEFDLNEMRTAVRRIALMADSRNQSMKLTFRNGEVELNAASAEEGEGTEIVPVDYQGEEMLLGFRWQYLYEFLNLAGVDTELEVDPEQEKRDEGLRVAFEFKDSNSATQSSIAGDTGYDYKYVVMPLRV
jgi:DNA polymerase-3 subunit beta